MLKKYLLRLILPTILLAISFLLFFIGAYQLSLYTLIASLILDGALSFRIKSIVLAPVVMLSLLISSLRAIILLFILSTSLSSLAISVAIWCFFSIKAITLALDILSLYGRKSISTYPLHNYSVTGLTPVTYIQRFLNIINTYDTYWFPARLLADFTILAVLLANITSPWFIALSFLLPSIVLCYIATLTIRSVKLYKSDAYKAELKTSNMYNPQVMVHVSGPTGSAYQVNQWLSVLEKLPQRVLIIFRSNALQKGFNSTTLPVLVARTLENIEHAIGPETKAVLYPSNAINNAQVLRLSQLKHIFINHGESDKSVNVSKFLRAYDKLYLAGKMAADRLSTSGLDIPPESLAYVGRPQLEMTLRKKNTNTSTINTILYAPTWEGFGDHANYTSVGPFGITIIEKLCKHYTLIFKPHPFTGLVNGSLKTYLIKIKEIVISNGGRFETLADIHQLMNQSDLLISDISSVTSDFLYTNKPFIVTNPRAKDLKTFENQFPSSKAAYIIAPDDNILDTVEEISGNDQKREERLRISEYSLGNYKNGALERFVEQLSTDCDLCL